MKLYVCLPDKPKQVYDVLQDVSPDAVLESVKTWPGVHLVSIDGTPRPVPMDEFNWSI